ncbi:MAG TPA: glutamyl-tRNA reductase [Gammaproteobacteria bacterium]|nr:glutamyl-tRNA reductase [Gammaproteobacteria bacterium]
MAFIACGLNHKTASVALREQVVFAPENTSDTLRQLLQIGAANEAMILSTCNRTEIYSHTSDPGRLGHWLAQHPDIKQVADTDHWYCYQDQQAVSHIMRVASGLDSMVLGEPQILGQMKQAFAFAREVGAVGTHLSRLLSKVFTVTKQVRTDTDIGANPVSVASAAVNLAKRIFANLAKCQVLLIGSGQIIELMALHLADSGVKQIVIANRSRARALKLAQQFSARVISLEEIPLYLQKIDMVIAATGNSLPLINKNTVARALKSGKRRPLLMVDLAVPRDIEPEVGQLEDVYLYNIDNLKDILTENLKSRLDAAEHAEQIINAQARFFMRQLQELDAVDTICTYREKLEQLRDTQLAEAMAQLKRGMEPEAVLKEMARVLTNQIMHAPTVQLRQAAFDGELQVLLAARKLFGL